MNIYKDFLHTPQRRLSCFLALLLSIGGFAQTALADQLPPVTGTSFDGSVISWDALDSATGYNIYRESRYIDTVSEGTQYAPDSIGRYTISAFDGNGNYSPLEVIDSDIVPTFNSAVVEFIDEFLDSPRNVFGTVYSRTAGEIFWDRDNSRSLSYTVTMNGEVLGTTAGNSFWIQSLPENTENVVTVKSTSSSGIMSYPSEPLLFDTRLQSYPYRAFDGFVGPQDGVAIAPQNARIEVYSSTAAELFWDRADAAEQITTTEIYRDSLFIGTSPGNSYFDDTRSPGTEYTYELIAVNIDGVRSATTYINPDPFDEVEGNDGSIIQSLLQGISEVTTDNPHVQLYPLIHQILAGDLPEGIVQTSSEDTVDEELDLVMRRTVYACDVGQITIDRSLETDSFADILFEDCATGEVFLSGYVFVFSRGELFESVDYLDLVIYSGDDDITLLGNVTTTRSSDSQARTIVYDSFEYYIFDLLGEDGETDTSVVLNQTIDFDGEKGSYPSSFTANFTVSAPWTFGRTLTLSTDEAFQTTASTSSNYIVGSFSVESEQNERLTLIADTGSYETWYAELTNSEGTTGETGEWSELIKLPCIDLIGECSQIDAQ